MSHPPTYDRPLVAGSGGYLEAVLFDNPRDRAPAAVTACTCTLETVPLAGGAPVVLVAAAPGTIPAAGVMRYAVRAEDVAAIAGAAPCSARYRFSATLAGEALPWVTEWVGVQIRA